MSVTNATPGSAPTAPASATTSAPSSSQSSTASAPSSSRSAVKPMSTADFKAQILGKKSSSSFSAPEPAVEDFSDDSDSAAQFYDSDSESSELPDNPAEEQIEESVEEQPAADWSWAEALQDYRDGVHGVATAELLQAIASGQIPEALMDKLTLTMKDGDEEWTGTVADLRNGAQMHANFTRKSQAFAQEKKQFEQERGELVDYLRSWKEDESGEKGLAGLEKMLGEEAVMRIARKLAERLERKEQLEAAEAAGHIPAGTAKLIMEREQMQRELEETRRFKQRQEQQATEQDVNTKATETGKRIQNEAVGQFKQLGFTVENGQLTPGVWNLFKQELQALWTDASKTPGPVEIRTAVMAAKQQMERIQREDAAEKAKRAATQKNKPAVTGAAPAGAPGAPKKQVSNAKKAMSTSDFKKSVMSGGSLGRR